MLKNYKNERGRRDYVSISMGKVKIEKSQSHNDIKNKNKKSLYDLTEEECIHLLEKVRWRDGVFCTLRIKGKSIKNGHVKNTIKTIFAEHVIVRSL